MAENQDAWREYRQITDWLAGVTPPAGGRTWRRTVRAVPYVPQAARRVTAAWLPCLAALGLLLMLLAGSWLLEPMFLEGPGKIPALMMTLAPWMAWLRKLALGLVVFQIAVWGLATWCGALRLSRDVRDAEG